MKFNLFLILCLVLFLTSCSKSENAKPIEPIPVVEESLKALSTTTIAGGQKTSLDGAGTSASFDLISKIAVDKSGIIYVLEFVSINNSLSYKIRKITTDNKVKTVFNSGTVDFDANNNVISQNKLFWLLKDITIDATGNVFALGLKTDYSTLVGSRYVDEWGIFKLNTTNSTLETHFTSKKPSGDGIVSTHDFSKIFAGENGVFYATVGKDNSNLGKGEVYKISNNNKELIASIDKMFDDVIFADKSGNVFIQVPDGISKISPQKQVTSHYKFEKSSQVSLKEKLTGDISGNLILYGPMFKTSGDALGDGLYKITNDGKKAHIGKITNSLLNGKMYLNSSNQLIFSPDRIGSGGSVLMKLLIN